MATASIQLSDSDSRTLREIVRRTGRSEEELLHEAVRRFLDQPSQRADWRALLARARGVWKDRDDLPDLRRLRAEFDRT